MKKTQILMVSVLLAFAFFIASCGSAGEKAKTEKAEVESAHDHDKDHECDQAKKDTCQHAKAEDHECDHEHEKEEKAEEDGD